MKTFLALLFTLCFSCTPAAENPRKITLSIFHTGNVAGELERCGCSEKQLGGVARRKTVYDRYRSGDTLLLDSGDVFFGSLPDLVGSAEFYAEKRSAMVRAMSRIGYDAAAVGDYDFAEGSDFLIEGVKEANFPFLCANLAGSQATPVLEPFRVIRRSGLRIGIVAFLDSHVVTERYRKSLGDLRIDDPFDVAKRVLPKLQQQSDLIVALLHFNLTDVDTFLKANPGIDVALIGHHVGKGTARQVGRTVVVTDGELGKKLGRLTLHLDGKARLLDFEGGMIPIEEETVEDPEVREVVSYFNEVVRRKKFSEDVFFLPPEKDTRAYLGAEGCAPCHPVIYQRWSNTPHAYAFNSLVEKGYEYNPECVVCHVVGYRARRGFTGAEKTPHLLNVQCESCHGAGAGHPAEKSMTAGVPEDACRKCHNDKRSPDFNYTTYLEISEQCTLP